VVFVVGCMLLDAASVVLILIVSSVDPGASGVLRGSVGVRHMLSS
jgi:hypothetical protein